jgi:hypothetical protein
LLHELLFKLSHAFESFAASAARLRAKRTKKNFKSAKDWLVADEEDSFKRLQFRWEGGEEILEPEISIESGNIAL